MSALVKSIMKELGTQGISRISEMIGQDRRSTGDALSQIVPSLIHGLSRNSADPEGARSLNGALERDHDGSIFDDLLGSLGNLDEEDGQGILGHIFGDKKKRVEKGLSRRTGLDASTVLRLMSIAAPIVMGLLGKARKQKRLDSEGISELLGKEDRRLVRKRKLSPILSFLDSDSDGDITDDLVNIGSGLLSRLFRRR